MSQNPWSTLWALYWNSLLLRDGPQKFPVPPVLFFVYHSLKRTIGFQIMLVYFSTDLIQVEKLLI